MSIPSGHNWSRFWERVAGGKIVQREVSGRILLFLVQPTTVGFVHVCTIDDVCTMLQLIPPSDWEDLKVVCFRQPTRKQAAISSTWGRLAYHADFVDQHGRPLCDGGAVVLEATNLNRQVRFGLHLDPQDEAERGRLIEDGHVFDRRGAYRPNLEASRNTVLYRTLLHELGHWVDHLDKVERPANSIDDSEAYERLSEAYFQRPESEREAFAHRYANETRARLLRSAVIPFSRTVNVEELRNAGIPEGCFVDPLSR